MADGRGGRAWYGRHLVGEVELDRGDAWQGRRQMAGPAATVRGVGRWHGRRHRSGAADGRGAAEVRSGGGCQGWRNVGEAAA